MKTLLVALLLQATTAFAGEILGIPTGLYEGKGTLTSQTTPVPNLGFTSLRALNNDGSVTVTSRAYLNGELPLFIPPVLILPVGIPFSVNLLTVTGHLKFVPKSEDRIEILNLDEVTAGKPVRAGSARCDVRACTFTVTIKQGSLTLTETWVRDGDGFRVENGSQTMNVHGFKVHAIYSADFTPKH